MKVIPGILASLITYSLSQAISITFSENFSQIINVVQDISREQGC